MGAGVIAGLIEGVEGAEGVIVKVIAGEVMAAVTVMLKVIETEPDPD